MITHDLIQGSDEWHQFRLEHFGASEAAAMLGLSKKVTRTELLHMKSTGTAREFSDWVQKNILDYGHEVEALARPIIEDIFTLDLYPVTCSSGKLSASCDGLTLCETIAFEHKQANRALTESVRNNILPEEYMPQCQQILMITGAERVIFTVSDGTSENLVWMDIKPDSEWFDRIRAGWEQFSKDLAVYVPFEVIEPAKAPAAKDLPAVTIQVRGELTMSNLSEVTPHFDQFLDGARVVLKTDDDFAIAESEAKLGRETAKRCKLTAKAVIDQISTVSEAVRTLEEYASKFDALALKQETAVKEQKESIKNGILKDIKAKFAEHVATLQVGVVPIRLAFQDPPFASAMKSKRTLKSLHDAVNTALANAKIVVDGIAESVRLKLVWYKENAAGYEFLFPDLQEIILKETDDFQMLVQNRIAQHKADQAKARVKAMVEAQAAPARSVTESIKPTLANSSPSVNPDLAALARHELVCFRKKFASIKELVGVMEQIDLYLATTDQRQTVEA